MKLGHEMILASAGSGKTHALTNRFVRLLALGAAPERIVALTFTRKAAGEFFDAILRKLARAAADPAAAAGLAREIAVPAAGPADFLRLLRAVVEAMHRLRLGTFDGFFASIVKKFPLELGLAGEFEVLEEPAAQSARQAVLRQIFARGGRLTGAQHEFIEAFKQATFGREEKRLVDKLAQFLDEHQAVFLDAPAGELWGNPARIWPEGSPWFAETTPLGETVTALRGAAETQTWDERRQAWWGRLFAVLATWTPGAPMGTELGNVLKALPDMTPVTMDRKKVEPPPPLRTALLAVARAVMRAELTRRIEMTRGLHAVLAAYDEVYHHTVRRAGRLTFADVQRLLLPAGEGGRRLSTESDGEGRLLIDYRLDAETDHWLLDEFQDTSFGQWSVLKNLIDEAVQDPTGRRSFFYVGDVKQAIYAWREGDPRLFREIFDHYNGAVPGAIAEGHLDRSWRSGPAVVAMVNAVFGAAEVLARLFPASAAGAWNREWRAHASARPGLGGHAALLLAEDEAARFATTLALLRELPSPGPGFSVAVLVQKNDTAARLADFLRREGGIAAVAEADLQVCADHPTGAALLALVQAAAHPGNSLAWLQVQMSPLGAALSSAGVATPEALSRHVLAQIADEGFAATLRGWSDRLPPADAFTRLRLRQTLAAAAEFDAGGGRTAAEFVDFMRRYTLREPDSAAVVRVMTIHKSKGLGFDVVILPDLEGQKLDQPRRGLAVRRDADRAVDWVLDLPVREIAEKDAVLADRLREAAGSACYEKLSLLYVAMTRAKHALYVVTELPKKSAGSANFTRLLHECLGKESLSVTVGGQGFSGVWAEGDPAWHRQLPRSEPEANAARPPRIDRPGAVASRRLVARRPSEGPGSSLGGAALFAFRPGAGRARDFGRHVHALLAGVEWLDGTVPAALVEKLTEAGEAGNVALACLRSPDLTAVWTRRAAAGLWREQAFEVVMDGTWITGVFDRVIVVRDAAGRPLAAEVYDFKTDEKAEGAVDRHAGQLRLYGAAAARLLGLPETAVRRFLVMTRLGRCLEVPLAGGGKGP